MDVKGTTWLILGMARSGCAAGALLRRHGARVIAADDAPCDQLERRWRERGLTDLAAAAHDVLICGPDWIADAPDAVAGVVVSPGVPGSHPGIVHYRDRAPILGELEAASRFCRSRIIAITGTNGKTTTTELTAHLLRSAGLRAEALGNVGRPLSLVADDLGPRDVAVVEVSSFQLETISGFRPDVAAVLNLAPDHQDRYAGTAEYFAAKRKLVDALGPDGTYVTWTGCPEAVAWAHPHTTLFGDRAAGAVVQIADGGIWLSAAAGEAELLVHLDEMALHGAPNALNAAAAVACVLPLALDRKAIAAGLKTFVGLPHRQERVAEVGGVVFVNDSKATNVHAVCSGLSGYESDVVLIVGGSGKDENYSPLRAAMGPVKAVVGLGVEGPAITAVLGDDMIIEQAADIVDAVARAARLAAGRGTVLLSPACASFDMFRDYVHRGDAFRDAAIAFAGSVSGGREAGR